MTDIHLATALVRRGDSLLLVASRYPNHAGALWNMPGGRQQPPELLEQTALRELREETGLLGTVADLAYVSESYDGDVHFINATFIVHAAGEPRVPRSGSDHIEACGWVPITELAQRLSVAVVREPLVAHIGGSPRRYFSYAVAGISIVFPDASQRSRS